VGCKLPDEEHGDPNNIVEEHLKRPGENRGNQARRRRTGQDELAPVDRVQMDQGELGSSPKQDYN
jgi:hypothetical protein